MEGLEATDEGFGPLENADLEGLQRLAQERYRRIHTVHWKQVPSSWLADYARVQMKISEVIMRSCSAEQKASAIIAAIQALDRALLVCGPSKSLLMTIERLEAENRAIIMEHNHANITNFVFVQANLETSAEKVSIGEHLEQLTVSEMWRQHDLPHVVKRYAELWSAVQSWRHLDYFIMSYGHRLVPVEVGKSYLEGNWSQELVSLADFIQRSLNLGEPLYLAQHSLISQFPSLAADIEVPDYCYMSLPNSKDEPIINIWLGLTSTVTPFHSDPYYNMFVQICGAKRFLLVDPSQATRISQDVQGTEDLHRLDIPYQEVWLRPSDALYIPPKWWHYVETRSSSISISFWF